jgi:hypothetical protein
MLLGVRGRMMMSAGGVLGAATVAFGAVAPPEHCPPVTVAGVHAAAADAAGWFVRNQNPDGTWLYSYEAETDTVIDDYNTVRHAGAVMGLYQAAAAGIEGAFVSADRGLAWAMGHVVVEDDRAALADPGSRQVPAGATALLVSGLVERRLLTGELSHDADLRRFGAFLAAQVEPSGAFLAYFDLDTHRPLAGVYSKYYTGESYWALARLHSVFPDESWGDAADRIGAYLATARDDRESHWPPIADHWAAYGLSETVTFPERAGRDRPLTDY